jgi:hypothetical protein
VSYFSQPWYILTNVSRIKGFPCHITLVHISHGCTITLVMSVWKFIRSMSVKSSWGVSGLLFRNQAWLKNEIGSKWNINLKFSGTVVAHMLWELSRLRDEPLISGNCFVNDVASASKIWVSEYFVTWVLSRVHWAPPHENNIRIWNKQLKETGNLLDKNLSRCLLAPSRLKAFVRDVFAARRNT